MLEVDPLVSPSDVDHRVGEARQPADLPPDPGGHRGEVCQPDLLQPGGLPQPPDILVPGGPPGPPGEPDTDQGPADLQPPHHPPGQGGGRDQLQVHCLE